MASLHNGKVPIQQAVKIAVSVRATWKYVAETFEFGIRKVNDRLEMDRPPHNIEFIWRGKSPWDKKKVAVIQVEGCSANMREPLPLVDNHGKRIMEALVVV
jgi:hypothetical protein